MNLFAQTTPELISPEAGAVLDNGCLDHSDLIIWDFDWTDVSGATDYNLFVIGANASIPVIDTEISNSEFHYETTLHQ
jgi:hypothetical protein